MDVRGQCCLPGSAACAKWEFCFSKSSLTGFVPCKQELTEYVTFTPWDFFSSHYNADFVLYMLCRTIFDTEKLLEFAKLGCYLEYDLFGTEFLHYQFHPDIDMPSDNERIARYLLQWGLSSSIAIDKWILLVLVLKGITEWFC